MTALRTSSGRPALPLIVAVSAFAAVSLSSCASDGNGRPALDTGATVSTGLVPERDEFAFANFTAADTAEYFDVEDLKSMFGAGPDVCLYGDAITCSPTPEAAAFARMVNLARSSGHCEGLVVRAAELFAQHPPTAVAEMPNSGEVTHGVIRTFASQLFGAVRREAESWSARPLAAIVAELESSLAAGETRYSMGLYTQSGGHTVLPYAMERLDVDRVRIDVYDPNWPGRRRHVEVDLASGRWLFSFSSPDPASDPSPWAGGRGDIDLVSMEARHRGGCPFCGEQADGGGLMLVRSTGSDWAVRTRGDVLTAGSSTDVAGVVRPLRAVAAGVRDYVLDIADASRAVEMTVSSSTRVTALWPAAIVEVQVVEPAAPVRIVIEPTGVSVTGGVATVTVSRGHLGLSVTADHVEVRHGSAEIVSVDGAGRRVRVDSSHKTNVGSVNDLVIDLPRQLTRGSDGGAPTASNPVAPAGSSTPTSTSPKVTSKPAGGTLSPVRVTFDVSQWSLAPDAEGSYGFTAADLVGGAEDETQICRSIACLGDKTVWLARGGYDTGRDQWVLSPYEFRVTGVRAPFDIKCGRRAGWSPAASDGGTHWARCSFDSLESDTVISLRTS